MHIPLFLLALLFTGCTSSDGSEIRVGGGTPAVAANRRIATVADSVTIRSDSVRQLVRSALEQTEYTVEYDPAYVALEYPGGDVPRTTGVCADVIVRALRGVGIDLQKEIHEDMKASFSSYPKKWGLRRPDRNIDHRRVPNMMTFFQRRGASLRISDDPADYLPGDIVAWELDNGLLHVGILSNLLDPSGRLLAVHNIGGGARLEDVLFAWKIIGHYRYVVHGT
jgi:uncharacterized protein